MGTHVRSIQRAVFSHHPLPSFTSVVLVERIKNHGLGTKRTQHDVVDQICVKPM